jgi:hypothetical protein
MHSSRDNLEYWKGLVGDCHAPCSMAVWCGSPISIVIADRFRARAADRFDLGPTVPVDRFLFGKGPPSERYQSRINGPPYRPVDRPWPVDRAGKALLFFAQLCFSDSQDYISGLPGDVLVIFIRTMEFISGLTTPCVLSGDRDSLAFEWYPLGLTNLVEPEAGPAPTNSLCRQGLVS